MTSGSPAPPREHDFGSVSCWCQPTVYRLCSECDGDGCWRCEGQAPWPGLLPATAFEAQDECTPCLVIHDSPGDLPPAEFIRKIILSMQADLQEDG